jgi:hypothetical protein
MTMQDDAGRDGAARGGGSGSERDRRELDVAWGRIGEEVVAATWTAARPVPGEGPPAGDGPVWLVWGGTPRAGQSCLTVALALAWAAQGYRVLMLDLDPAEDLARTLHVGWALRPGTTHTLAHALETGWLDPASSIVPGLEVASLGALPAHRPALGDAVVPKLRRMLARPYDRILVDLPYAAGLPGLAALTDARLDVLRGDAVLSDARLVAEGLPPRRAVVRNAVPNARDAQPGGDFHFPSFDRPELGPWALLTGAAGARAEHAALALARRLDGWSA